MEGVVGYSMSIQGKSVRNGIAAAIVLFGLYVLVITLVSGWEFAKDQFSQFWYFIAPLALGFGIQVGLYSFLRMKVHGGKGSGGMVAVSGTTSTIAMLSCCSHYLVNILPVIGVTGVVSLLSQYRVELFWVGLVFSLGGILFILYRIRKVTNIL